MSVSTFSKVHPNITEPNSVPFISNSEMTALILDLRLTPDSKQLLEKFFMQLSAYLRIIFYKKHYPLTEVEEALPEVLLKAWKEIPTVPLLAGFDWKKWVRSYPLKTGISYVKSQTRLAATRQEFRELSRAGELDKLDTLSTDLAATGEEWGSGWIEFVSGNSARSDAYMDWRKVFTFLTDGQYQMVQLFHGIGTSIPGNASYTETGDVMGVERFAVRNELNRVHKLIAGCPEAVEALRDSVRGAAA